MVSSRAVPDRPEVPNQRAAPLRPQPLHIRIGDDPVNITGPAQAKDWEQPGRCHREQCHRLGKVVQRGAPFPSCQEQQYVRVVAGEIAEMDRAGRTCRLAGSHHLALGDPSIHTPRSSYFGLKRRPVTEGHAEFHISGTPACRKPAKYVSSASVDISEAPQQVIARTRARLA